MFWARIANDGHLKVKSKRIAGHDIVPPREAENDIPDVLPALRAFVAHPDSVEGSEPRLFKTALIDYGDPLLELLPEAYLDSPEPTAAEIQAEVDEMARQTASFLIRHRLEGRSEEFA